MVMQVQIDWLVLVMLYTPMHEHAHLRAAVPTLLQLGSFVCLVSARPLRPGQSGVGYGNHRVAPVSWELPREVGYEHSRPLGS